MDKHERPYKCHESGCEKTPGFGSYTDYLRHQREGYHSGQKPGYSRFCPYKGCHRHVNKPFKRAENLREHMRRMHKLETNDHLERGGDVYAQAGIPKDVSFKPHDNRNQATCLSRDNILQMEADSLRDMIVKKERRIQELERQIMKLEAMNRGPQS